MCLGKEGGAVMYTCASCNVIACNKGEKENLPQNCPMANEEFFTKILSKYNDPKYKEVFIVSSEIEAAGYCKWPRLFETIEFCKRLKYKKIGVAFCLGLKSEASIITSIIKSHGFDVVSIACKAGGIAKETVGIPKEHKVHPEDFEAICNPITQAMLLNEQDTEFNIAVGLCVGHDSLFYKHSDAMVTTLIAKDRVLAHNPVGAVYCASGYFKGRLAPGAE